MKIISCANFKGGVGKTTTVRILGDLLCEKYRVLMIDLDPQASLTYSCGMAGVTPTLVDVLRQSNSKPISKVIIQIKENLYLAPSQVELALIDQELISEMGREQVLKFHLKKLARQFDLIIIDTAPNLGTLTTNALTASDGVLIPARAEPLDVKALDPFLKKVMEVRKKLNPNLTILGILPTFYDQRIISHRDGIEAMIASKWPVLPFRISRSIRAAEAAGYGESIVTFEPGSVINTQYRGLAEGIEKWLNG